MTRATLLLAAALLGGCYCTRSLGFGPGDEALIEREALGRTARYLLDVDRDAAPSRLRVRLLEVRGITERTRSVHERRERVEIVQTWPPPLGWWIRGETVRETRDAGGLVPGDWSAPRERFDVEVRAGQDFEVRIGARPPRRITAGDDGWAVFALPPGTVGRVSIRAETPDGALEEAVALR